MKISELIAQLQAIQAERGDLPVFLDGSDYDDESLFLDGMDFSVKEIEQSFSPLSQEFNDGMFREAGRHQRGIEGRIPHYTVEDSSKKPESFTALIIE